MFNRTFAYLLGLSALVALVGCGKSDPPAFRLDMVNVAEKGISAKHQQAIADILTAMFGTPDTPFAMPQTGLDERKLKMAAGPVWSDEGGGKHGLYRRHCAHCHGISGDGHGPTAGILNPYPRDYRRGVFKFKGTYPAAPPTDEDLHRLIYDGIPSTAMPAFALLPPDEVNALVEYVKYLTIRGQMETALVQFVSDELDPEDPLDPVADAELNDILVNDLLAGVMEDWDTVDEKIVVPTPDSIPPADRTPEEIAASVIAGRELFFGKATCVKCHGPTALGDGQQDNRDDWSQANFDFITSTEAMVTTIQESKKALAQLKGDERKTAQEELESLQANYELRRSLIPHLLPPRYAVPRNLREGRYRGGRRDIDLFWRVFSGIPGVGMPASGPADPGGQGTLTEQEMWQVVDYIMSLPYEPNSEPQFAPVNAEAVN